MLYSVHVESDMYDDDDVTISLVDDDALLYAPEQEDNSNFYLPPHQRYAARTLNLVASHDVEA
jgi:hypothetical protein